MLYGRIGALDLWEGRKFRTRDGVPASAPMMVLVQHGFRQHVLEPARHMGIDVFGHSWSVEAGLLLRTIFRPTLLQLEPPLSVVSEACKRIVSSGNWSRKWVKGTEKDCERVRSQFVGLRRALLLKERWEKAHRLQYRAVLLSRWDVLWQQEAPLVAFARSASASPRSFWLPRQCAPRAVPPREAPALRQRQKSACGGPSTSTLTSPAADDCADERFCVELRHRVSSADPRLRFERVARQLFVLDHWLVASSADASSVGELAGSFGAISEAVVALAPQRPWLSGHFYLGWHLLQVLNASLTFVTDEDSEWALGRHWAGREVCHDAAGRRGAPLGISAPQERWPSRLAEGLAHTHAGVALVQPAALLHRCGDGRDFRCASRSRACVQRAADARAADPMADVASRAAFLHCATLLCHSAGCDANTSSDARHAPATSLPRSLALLLRLWNASFLRATETRRAEGAAAPATTRLAADGPVPVASTEVGRARTRGLAIPSPQRRGEDAELRSHFRMLFRVGPRFDPRRNEVCAGSALPGSCSPIDPPAEGCDGRSTAEGGPAAGWWRVEPSFDRAGALASCVERCRRCAPCRFVTVAPSHRAVERRCRWYRACNPGQLEYQFDGAFMHITASVGKS